MSCKTKEQKDDLKKQLQQSKQSAKHGCQAPAFKQNLSTDTMMYLHYVKHYSYRQIAAEMGCSPNTVRNRISGKVESGSLWKLFYFHSRGEDTSEMLKQEKSQQSRRPVKCGFDAHAFRKELSTEKMRYLRYEKNYSYRQIAREMGCSPSTVRRRLNDVMPF